MYQPRMTGSGDFVSQCSTMFDNCSTIVRQFLVHKWKLFEKSDGRNPLSFEICHVHDVNKEPTEGFLLTNQVGGSTSSTMFDNCSTIVRQFPAPYLEPCGSPSRPLPLKLARRDPWVSHGTRAKGFSTPLNHRDTRARTRVRQCSTIVRQCSTQYGASYLDMTHVLGPFSATNEPIIMFLDVMES